MKPTTIPTLKPIKDIREKRSLGKDFYPSLEDLNEEYIKQNMGIDER